MPISASMDRGVFVSLGARMASADGRPSGFDYMRLFLAVSVMVMHITITTYGQQADFALWASPWRPLLRAIVPAFFVLSGFLVCGSLYRCRTLFMFAGLRAIRIYPALSVEVLISAFLMGPFVSTMAPPDYFTDAQFLRYLVNVTGHISYQLPGVFTGNPFPDIVNAQLWTVPFELYCYLALIVAALAGIRRHRLLTVIAVILVMAGHLAARLIRHGGHYEPILGAPPGPLLIGYFLAGIAFYQYRDEVPANPLLAAVSAAVAGVSLAVLPLGEYVAIPALGYLTVYLGTADPRRTVIAKAADYSYGIYLYGFVVQQFVMALWPHLRTWYWNALICIPLATILAAISWHWIELPATKFRPVLNRLENRWVAFMARLPKVGGVQQGA
ncbi:acyltransferase [Novosphingobium sp. KCTC 2891]|uniref:acyltransferase family protein n=1 Tax=Novosphingobium sp. KCTC 2891 TaxID=2989730 RepID=UPI00222346B8|nr:acyltransferase [Novosphingobium sp. KCTC 2891]MCW1382031.1 acyltransferase [Novosphingobium sp. KCTC 2891]